MKSDVPFAFKGNAQTQVAPVRNQSDGGDSNHIVV